MKITITTLLLINILLLSVVCSAQPDPFGDFEGDVQAPLDNWLAILIAVTIGYTAKKLFDDQKKRKDAG